MSFEDLGLSALLLKAVAEAGYTAPTPIQAQAIPAVLSGGDLLAGAQTGTGKTAAFVLPLLQRLANEPRRRGMRALIVAPTRELVVQIDENLRAYARHFGEDEAWWGIAGLLHDFDYERWPDPPHHPLQGAAILADRVPFAAAHATGSAAYRYCSEALLEGSQLDRKQLTRILSPFGDSLVVAGGGSRLRVHVHTNEPYRLFATLAKHASITRTKIDDMVLQQLAAARAKVALVTDSSCDLPETICHALQLVRVPLSLSFGEEVFLDGVDITPAQFYRHLATNPHPPRTSQPAVGEFRKVYRTLLETHEAVLSIHLSAGLSGTYQAALAASREVDPQRIMVMDSKQLSITLGLVVEAAGEARQAGGALAQVAAAAERAAAATKLYATFPSLDTAVRGGRVPAGMARAARLFRLAPILSIDSRGVAEKVGVAFGFASALHRLASRADAWGRGGRVRALVAHANAIGAAERLTGHLMQRLGAGDIAIVNLAPVLAAHTGPGAVGVAVTIVVAWRLVLRRWWHEGRDPPIVVRRGVLAVNDPG